MPRVRFPKRMRDILLHKNARACCVCKARFVGLNLHHIDGDASNTVEENIAVLCVRDHDAHHRPVDYLPDAPVNHLDLNRETILAKKMEWETFVVEARKPHPAIVATFTAYGNTDLIHSAKLAFQWADSSSRRQIVFERVFHLLNGPVSDWIDQAMNEVAWLGQGIRVAITDRPLPVGHCPVCRHGMTTTISSGFARRLTSRTWEISSVCSIYVNPNQASLAVRIEDDKGPAFVATLHPCGAFLDLAMEEYHERFPITGHPPARVQAERIVKKILGDWQPSRTLIGTGPSDHPVVVETMALPKCWDERIRGGPHGSFRRRTKNRTRDRRSAERGGQIRRGS